MALAHRVGVPENPREAVLEGDSVAGREAERAIAGRRHRGRVACRVAAAGPSGGQIRARRGGALGAASLRRVFDAGELHKRAVVAQDAATAADGKTCQVEYYNLDAILSVGYRVNPKRGTQFRIWTTATLREYLLRAWWDSSVATVAMTVEFPLRVVLYPAPDLEGQWIAHGLETDVVTQGDSAEHALAMMADAALGKVGARVSERSGWGSHVVVDDGRGHVRGLCRALEIDYEELRKHL